MTRALVLLVFAACSSPRPPRVDGSDLLNRGRSYAYCDFRRFGIDLEQENAAALAEAERIATTHGMPFDAIVVPGFTPIEQEIPKAGVHPIAKERLLRAILAWERNVAPFIVLSGGNVHPDQNPFNEAIEMKRALTSAGFPETRVLVEPCARHSTTNLRNTGRLLLSAGLLRGLIVTSYDQAYYFTYHIRTRFSARQVNELGYRVGRLSAFGQEGVAFVPTPKNFRVGDDAFDP